mmetsp:Transcript_14357/g.56502  ORF Transcript_14357/g.56502 Transcript_14357/m.56502 type:complete len:298 (+) Transcript_14357:378-1271(+)
MQIDPPHVNGIVGEVPLDLFLALRPRSFVIPLQHDLQLGAVSIAQLRLPPLTVDLEKCGVLPSEERVQHGCLAGSTQRVAGEVELRWPVTVGHGRGKELGNVLGAVGADLVVLQLEIRRLAKATLCKQPHDLLCKVAIIEASAVEGAQVAVPEVLHQLLCLLSDGSWNGAASSSSCCGSSPSSYPDPGGRCSPSSTDLWTHSSASRGPTSPSHSPSSGGCRSLSTGCPASPSRAAAATRWRTSCTSARGTASRRASSLSAYCSSNRSSSAADRFPSASGRGPTSRRRSSASSSSDRS